MSGNRHNSGRRYYFCYPRKQRSAKVPDGHPPTIYLGEEVLHRSVTDWLARAILGPDRVEYWRAALDAADTIDSDHRTDAAQRLAELEQQIGDLTRRLHWQILNLEDDQLSAEARRLISVRIGELETDIASLQALAEQVRHDDQQRPPDHAETIDALARIPVVAERVDDLPQAALRRFYDSLALSITYDPDDRAIDIEVTLADQTGISTTAPPDHLGAGPATQDCSVPPAGHHKQGKRP